MGGSGLGLETGLDADPSCGTEGRRRGVGGGFEKSSSPTAALVLILRTDMKTELRGIPMTGRPRSFICVRS